MKGLRAVHLSVALSALLLLAPTWARAEETRILAPSPAGSGWDQIGQALRASLTDGARDGPVTVVNVPGGGGTAGLAQFLADGSPDTLLVGGLTLVVAAELHRDSALLDRLLPIAKLSADPYVVVVSAESPIRSLDDLKVAMAGDPTKVSWGGGQPGSAEHVATILFGRALGVGADRVTYGAFLSSADAAAAVGDEKVSAGILPGTDVAGGIKNGRLRPIAVAASTRQPGIDAPTLTEGGVPFAFSNWRGVFARATMSTDSKARLVASIAAATTAPAWQAMLEERGWDGAFAPADVFGMFFGAERDRVRAALAAAGLPRP